MKSWIVIPAMGVVSAALGVVLAGPVGLAVGLAGAAIAVAVRALGQASATNATNVACVLGALLATAMLAEHRMIDVHDCIALAAAAWTIALLAKPTGNPLVAMLPATIAGVLEPAAIALVPIAGTRLVTTPWRGAEPKKLIAVPIVGALAVMLAVIAGSADGGALATLAHHWYGTHAESITTNQLAFAVGDALGPLTAVAALAGFAASIAAASTSAASTSAIPAKPRLAELALVALAIGALLVDLRAGAVGVTTFGVAALCAAIAIGRFAAMIRLPSIQALAGATAAVMLLVPPAWTVLEHVR